MSQHNDRPRDEGVRCFEEEPGDARSIILRRRARFLALALAAVQTGATACGGKSDQNTAGAGGNGCLSYNAGSAGYCLSYWAGNGGTGAVGGGGASSGSGGVPSGSGPCLGMPLIGGEGGGDSGIGGWQVCLSPPLPAGGAGGQPEGGSSGDDAGGNAGSETGGAGGG